MASRNSKKAFLEAYFEELKDSQTNKLAKARYIKKVKQEFLKVPYPKGYKLSSEDKSNILHIYYTLQTDKNFDSLQNSNLYELSALLYGCTSLTVKKVIENEGDYEDNRKNRFIQEKHIPVEYKKRFEDEVRKGLQKGVRLTTNFLKHILFEDDIFVSKSTLTRKAREWGLCWGSLTEKDYRRKSEVVLSKKTIYLSQLSELDKNKKRVRVYCDESFVHTNHSVSKGWYIAAEGREINRPIGLGPRIAMMAAITEESWLGSRSQNIKRCLATSDFNDFYEYKSIKYWQVIPKDSDKGNVNYKIFKVYFEETLIPLLPINSIIILDNAKYHRRYSPDIFRPRSNSTKESLSQYLESQGEIVDEGSLRPELLARAKKIFQHTKTEIQEIAEAYGHTVLYLPPYHPELNPIEYAWGYVKRIVSEESPYNANVLKEEVLPKAFSMLPLQVIKNFFSHVRKTEEEYTNQGSEESPSQNMEIESSSEESIYEASDCSYESISDITDDDEFI